MQPPTITEKQAKKALSGKKKKKGETIKNLFVSPFAGFWPLLNEEDNSDLLETLKNFLPRLKNEKISIPYAQIRSVKKADRKKYRQEVTQQEPIIIEDNIRNNIIFGINDVTKSLETQKARGVLVASDASPRFLVQHIIDQSVLLDCPVLVVTNLRDTLKSKCGISSVVVAFGKDSNENSPLSVIAENIISLGQVYRKPSSHMHFNRDISTIEIEDSDDEPIPQNTKAEAAQSECCYLIRTDPNKRVFVPDNKTVEVKKKDIIKFDLTTPVPPKKKKLDISLRPLTVKRVKGNKKRVVQLANRLKKKKQT